MSVRKQGNAKGAKTASQRKHRELNETCRQATTCIKNSMGVSFEKLSRARKKPQACSDARWRIELARRKRVSMGIVSTLDPDGIRTRAPEIRDGGSEWR